MMNVDDPPRIGVHKFLGKDLHVTCEYDEVNAMPLQQCHNLSLGCPLIVFLGRHQEERDAIKIRNRLAIDVVGYNARDIASKFVALMTLRKVSQAVMLRRNQ